MPICALTRGELMGTEVARGMVISSSLCDLKMLKIFEEGSMSAFAGISQGTNKQEKNSAQVSGHPVELHLSLYVSSAIS